MRVLNKNLPSPLRDIDLGMMLRPNYGGFLTSAALLRSACVGDSRQLASSLGDVSMMDIAQGLAAGLPKGIYTGRRTRGLRRRDARRPRSHR